MSFNVSIDTFPLAQAFTISRGSRTEAHVVRVTLEKDGKIGHGECVPYARYDETPDSVVTQLKELTDPFDHAGLDAVCAPGAARNALDCALWDLQAKSAGKRVWELADLARPGPEITAYTLSLDTAEAMREQAAINAHWPLLKTKLGGDGDVARIEAVRAGAPNARIIVDANEGWTLDMYRELAPVFARLGVEMVEQPFPAGSDDALLEVERVLPVCADESSHTSDTLGALQGKYDMVNIKLDKTGGLTEALRMRDAARQQGFDVMVGCMVGTSLGMAPAVLVAQGAKVTDLDGPLLLKNDRPNGLHYDEQGVHPSVPELWG